MAPEQSHTTWFPSSGSQSFPTPLHLRVDPRLRCTHHLPCSPPHCTTSPISLSQTQESNPCPKRLCDELLRSRVQLQEEGADYLRLPPISPEHLGPHGPHQLTSSLHASRATLPADRTFRSRTHSRHAGHLAGRVEPQDLERTQRTLEIEKSRLSFSTFKKDGPNNPPLPSLDLTHCRTALRFKAR